MAGNPLFAGSIPERFAAMSLNTGANSGVVQFDYLPKEQRGGLSVQISGTSGFVGQVYADNGLGIWNDVTSLVCGVGTLTSTTKNHFFAAHFFPWKVMLDFSTVTSFVNAVIGL